MLEKIDDFLQLSLGIFYLKITRDYSIHERCNYLIHNLSMSDFLESPRSLIDIGCGSGMALRYLAKKTGITHYTGVDLETARLKRRYQNIVSPTIKDIQFMDIDITDDWRVDRLYDIAWSSEVLEHIIDDQGALRRIARCIRPGGIIILTMPSLQFIQRAGQIVPFMLEVSATQDGGHVRQGYTAESIDSLAKSADLELLRIDGISKFTIYRTKRRYLSSLPMQLVGNIYDWLRLAQSRQIAIGADFKGREAEFHSIGAILRVPA